MEQVGYDTYCNLLDEVMKEMQGIEVEEEPDIQIDMNISSYIPDEYIFESSQKIEVYQNIALCKTEEDIQNVLDEVLDRYGETPRELNNLIEVSRIKMMCKEKYIIKVSQRGKNIVFTFNNKKFDLSIIEKLLKIYENKIKFSPGNPYITLQVSSAENDILIKEVKEFINNI
jgi:transcription-repair coupling factor (superfamily II helicase)